MNAARLEELILGNQRVTILGCWFHKSEEVEMDIQEWLQMQEPNLYHDRIFKLVQMWDKHITLPRDYVDR